VKGYTDLFVIDSWDIARNETQLNEICNYTANAGLKFIVYFDLISGTADPSHQEYPWHRDWVTSAKTKWGDKFLGIYLHDELGGKQLDEQQYVQNASGYTDAANQFVANIKAYSSLRFAKNYSIPIFTSDYALYWWDYLGGYDTMFVELGWNHSTTQQIALCRGAANMQAKDWGAIILWKYDKPPYLGTGQELYSNMLAAYKGGAKYVLIFDYAETNPTGILNEEHFEAMKNFYAYVKAYPRIVYGQTDGTVAFVMPANYGWGARWHDENIWGLWPADEKSPLIWENMNKLTDKYGLALDIVFDDPKLNNWARYSRVYFWNSTIN
jgi:hypothetical protein